jgi:hypothetical protein
MITENLDLIRRGYEAFGRGDISTVLLGASSVPLVLRLASLRP